MADILAVLVALFVFFLMFFIKAPIKRITYRAAKCRAGDDASAGYTLYRRMNAVLILLTIVLAVVVYYVICVLGGLHHKLCCSFKAAVMALALYAAYDQWFCPGGGYGK